MAIWVVNVVRALCVVNMILFPEQNTILLVIYSISPRILFLFWNIFFAKAILPRFSPILRHYSFHTIFSFNKCHLYPSKCRFFLAILKICLPVISSCQLLFFDIFWELPPERRNRDHTSWSHERSAGFSHRDEQVFRCTEHRRWIQQKGIGYIASIRR